jgi:Tfp pilus assembly protein PilV
MTMKGRFEASMQGEHAVELARRALSLARRGYSRTTVMMRAQMRRSGPLGGQRGAALLEVLVAGTVQAIALIGVAMMFSTGQGMIVAEGSERVELYLAEQKLENLRALGFPGAGTGSHTETLTTGQGSVQSFTRETCVYYVSNATLGEPAGAGCAVGAATATKRARVTVTPANHQASAVTLETVLVDVP